MFKYLLFLSHLFLSIKSNLYGIDISYHNGEIDFSKIKSKVDFVIMRSGYGNKTVDSKELNLTFIMKRPKKIISQ